MSWLIWLLILYLNNVLWAAMAIALILRQAGEQEKTVTQKDLLTAVVLGPITLGLIILVVGKSYRTERRDGPGIQNGFYHYMVGQYFTTSTEEK